MLLLEKRKRCHGLLIIHFLKKTTSFSFLTQLVMIELRVTKKTTT